MQTELMIKNILGDNCSVSDRVNRISKFMLWNKDKLTKSIMKYGTSTDKQRSSIINEFWGENKKHERR